MVGINPNLTAQEALTVLRNTSTPLTNASCVRPTGRDCGAGLINALAAVQAVGQPSTPTATSGQTLAVSPNPVDFGATASEVSLTLANTTASDVSYSIDTVNWHETNPAPFVADLLGGDPLSGTIPVGGSVTMTMFLDRSKIPADGQYAFEYVFEVNGQQELVFGRFVQGGSAGTPTGETLVASVLLDENGDLLTNNGDVVLGGAVFYQNFAPAYDFEAVPGNHLVLAWVDENATGEIDDGDFIGVYDEEGVLVTEQVGKDGIDVSLSQSAGTAEFSSETEFGAALEGALKELR